MKHSVCIIPYDKYCKERLLNRNKTHFAFSLIEIMVGLIITSVMVAAFAPVITKKVNSSATTLSAIASKNGIKDKVYTFQAIKNNIDGCQLSADNSSLKCPFIVPSGVSKINAVIVSPGGGGGGAAPSEVKVTAKNIDHYTNYSIEITSSLKNVKINELISSGGDGSKGNLKYTPPYQPCDTETKNCTERNKYCKNSRVKFTQRTCRYIVGDEYKNHVASNIKDDSTTGGNCFVDAGSSNGLIEAGNACNSIKFTTADIRHGSTKISSRDEGWELIDEHKDTDSEKNTTFNDILKERLSIPEYQTYLCPSADMIYENINSLDYIPIDSLSTIYVYGSCGSPIPNFATINHNNLVAQTGDGIKRLLSSNNIPAALIKLSNAKWISTEGDAECKVNRVTQYRLATVQTGTHRVCYNNGQNCHNEPTYSKQCRTNGVSGGSSRNNYNINISFENSGYYPLSNITHWTNEHRSCYPDLYDYHLTGYRTTIFIGSAKTDRNSVGNENKCYNANILQYNIPQKTFCKLKSTYNYYCDPISAKHIIYTGAGGGSGAQLSNIMIPNDVLAANIGGRLYFVNEPGRTSVYITKNGNIKWGVRIFGGKSGRMPEIHSNRVAIGGKGTKEFFLNTGRGWVEYNTIPQAIQGATFNKGNDGKDGIYEKIENNDAGYFNGGTGGRLSNSFGQGGNGSNIRSEDDIHEVFEPKRGREGLINVEYQNVLPGAGGGGGGAGSLIKLENIAVKPDDIIYVTVGKGGTGGNIQIDGTSGGNSSIKYNSTTYTLQGGEGGKKGTSATIYNQAIQGNGGRNRAVGINSSNITLKINGLNGSNAIAYPNDDSQGIGGTGGLSPIIEYLHRNPNNRPYNDFSIPCGGMQSNSDFNCNLNGQVNASYTGTVFAHPNKIYKGNSTGWGQAGSGGGGGGYRLTPKQTGTGADGQNGYVYLWWQEDED